MCLWVFTDDAFAANEFVARALLRAPNLIIYAQSPSHSTDRFVPCNFSDIATKGSSTSIVDGALGALSIPLCATRRHHRQQDENRGVAVNAKEEEKGEAGAIGAGFAAHPRILPFPHFDDGPHQGMATRREARGANAAFLRRFRAKRNIRKRRRLADGDEDASEGRPTNNRQGAVGEGTSFLYPNQAANGGNEAPPSAVRLFYRGSPTGYPPLAHWLHHTRMGANRDVFLSRQRLFNRLMLRELRPFFFVEGGVAGGTAAKDTSPRLALPSLGELLRAAFGLLRQFHTADRLSAVLQLNGLGLEEGVPNLLSFPARQRAQRSVPMSDQLLTALRALIATKGSAANGVLPQRPLLFPLPLSTATGPIGAGGLRTSSSMPNFFNTSLSSRQLSSDVRIIALFPRPPQRSFSEAERRAVDAIGLATPFASSFVGIGQNDSSPSADFISFRYLGQRPMAGEADLSDATSTYASSSPPLEAPFIGQRASVADVLRDETADFLPTPSPPLC